MTDYIPGQHGLADNEIARVAFSIWESEGCPDGRAESHWTMAIEQLLVDRIERLREAVNGLTPSSVDAVWQQLRSSRHAVQVVAHEETRGELSGRPERGRDQAEDNKMLAQLSTAMFRAMELGDYRLAASLFTDGYSQVLDYESENGKEIHKGAITFDVGTAYLRCWDFYAAMHYYELAQDETRKTTGDAAFSVFNFDLFERIFWDTFDYGAIAHTNQAYPFLWGIPYDKTAAIADYGNLSNDTRLAYIVACSVRMRLQHLETHSHWNDSTALRLGYWDLAADLARLLEIEANRLQAAPAGGGPPQHTTIVPCLEQGFRNTNYGNLSDIMFNVARPAFPRRDSPAGPPTGMSPADYYEAAFDPLLAYIRDPANSQADRLGHALYLLGFTRNQVAHRFDSTTKLFQQIDDAKYLVDLFIALCRVDEWKSL